MRFVNVKRGLALKAIALLAVAAMAMVTTAEIMADEPATYTLVGNGDGGTIDRQRATIHSESSYAQSFTTGPAEHDWKLVSIRMQIHQWQTNAEPVLALHKASEEFAVNSTVPLPGPLIATLVTPNKGTGKKLFSVANGERVVLEPETTYTVVMTNSQPRSQGQTIFRVTEFDGNSTRLPGWTMFGQFLRRTSDDVWNTASLVTKMDIRGAPLGEREVVISTSDVDVAEGGSATYGVSLATPPAADVVVTINDPANNDVTAVPASLTFTNANWDTQQTVMVSAGSDTGTDDETATITHTVSSVTGYNGIAVDDVLVAVVDDENTNTRVSFAQSSYAVAEGGAVAVKLTLTDALSSAVTIPISKTDQGGATGYSGVPDSVTIDANATEASFMFTVNNNNANDDGQSVALTLGTLPSGVARGVKPSTTVHFDDDDVPQVTVSFDATTYTVTEGNSVTVTVDLSADPERTVVIPIDLEKLNDGTRTLEHSGAPSRLTFYSGETRKQFDVEPAVDYEDESGEGFTLTLKGGDLPSGVTRGMNSVARVEFSDSGMPPPELTYGFTPFDLDIPEGQSRDITVTLSAATPVTFTTSLDVSRQGGASGDDYTLMPNELEFVANSSSVAFRLTAIDDSLNDNDEGLVIGLRSLPDNVTAGINSTKTVSIIDNDLPTTVEANFDRATYMVDEGGDLTVTVELSVTPDRSVMIPITASSGPTTDDNDWSRVPEMLAFGPDDTSKGFTFTANEDSDNKDETIEISIGAAPSWVTKGSRATATVTIKDDEPSDRTISFSQATYETREGSNISVLVIISPAPVSTTVIPINKVHKGGASAEDYSGVPVSLSFNAGVGVMAINVAATQDEIDDDGESLELSFGALPPFVTAVSPSTATVSLVDDDFPAVVINFEASAVTAVEGTGFPTIVAVTLSAAPGRSVSVPLINRGLGGGGCPGLHRARSCHRWRRQDESRIHCLCAS